MSEQPPLQSQGISKIEIGTSPGDRHVLLIAVLVVVLPLVFFLRQHSWQEPLDADESVYALIAEDWRHGGKPYTTLWDNKPIGTFVLYRAAVTWFGYDEQAPRILATFATVITTLFIWMILAETLGRRVIVFGTLILWSLVLCMVQCHANGANVEIFLLPFIIGAYICLRIFERNGHELYLWLGYMVLVTSLLIKQVTLPYLMIPFIVACRRDSGRWGGLAIRTIAALVILAGVHIIVYWSAGYGPYFVVEQLRNNASHVVGEGNTLWRVGGVFMKIPFNAAIVALLPFVIAATVAAVRQIVTLRQGVASIVFPCFFFASAVAVALPEDNFPHYYVLLTPFVVIGTFYAVSWLRQRVAISLLVLGIAYTLAFTTRSYLLKTPEEISYEKHGNNSWFVRDRHIGKVLAEKGVIDTRLFVDGSHPGIYFYSRNQPATRFFVAWTHVSMKVTTWKQVFEELQRAPPFACILLNPIDSAFRAWLQKHYYPADSIAGAHVYVRIPHQRQRVP